MKKQRRYRKPISCRPCRHSKLRCDRQSPCASCKRRNCVTDCIYTDDETSGASRPINRNPALPLPLPSPESFGRGGLVGSQISSPLLSTALRETNHHSNHRAPSQEFTQFHWDSVLQRPIEHISYPTSESQDPLCQLGNLCFPFPYGPKVSTGELLAALPSFESCEYLITQYFDRISPFFHVLHGPTFQRQFAAFSRDPSGCSLSWLALLFIICSATVNTMDDNDVTLEEISSNLSITYGSTAISSHYRAMAMICLCQDNFLIRHSLSTLEALLILIYTISHSEGVERSWVLLGMALNIGIALQCNASKPPPKLNCIEIERQRRCWAGILMLHTYQAILFRDVDMSALLNTQATMPADVNDSDILEDKILQPSTQPTQMSVIKFKIQLFQLSTRICKELSENPQIDEVRLESFDAEVADEQLQWASTFLVDGAPSLLDTSSYALWCGLELYAHQLYLLLHRPFSRLTNEARYRPASRAKCIASSAALLDIHRKWVELPRFRNYRWYLHGMLGSCALHGAVTLASCLLERTDEAFDSSSYRVVFDAAVLRLNALQKRSPLYMKAYPILRHLQTMLSPEQFSLSTVAAQEFGNTFDNWIDNVQWLNPESIDWNFWDEVLNCNPSETPTRSFT